MPSVVGVVSVVAAAAASAVAVWSSSAAAVPQLSSGPLWEFGENSCSSLWYLELEDQCLVSPHFAQL